MTIGAELRALFQRDLTRLLQQLESFPDDASLWRKSGTMNSAGTLVLHLEGNLREYIGRQIGGVPYQRKRDLEFSATGVPRSELIARLQEVRRIVTDVFEQVPDERWTEVFPENVLNVEVTNRAFVIHLHGHLNYHMGQIDSARRWAGAAAVPYVQLNDLT